MDKTTLRRKVIDSGSHFFDPGSMRFFRSRLCQVVKTLPSGVVYFVTSERFSAETPRMYSVRRWDGVGSVETVGMGYARRVDALIAADAAARGE
jgi:hypothetical protein